MVQFKSWYKTKPKEPLIEPPPAEPKRPVALPRAPSIKINTKGTGTPRPSISVPAVESPAVTETPAPRKPSVISESKAVVSAPLQAHATPKRPLPDAHASASSVAKRPKMQTPIQVNGGSNPKRRKMVTLRTNNPKRLALVLAQAPQQPATPARTSLPGMPRKESPAEAVHDSIVAKPMRKPLPTGGESARKPLPTSGSSMSPPPPPPPKMTTNTNSGRPATGPGKAGSPQPPTPGSGVARPKIKIKRKPQPGASQSPPAP